jgi:hypothetical protein
MSVLLCGVLMRNRFQDDLCFDACLRGPNALQAMGSSNRDTDIHA